MIIAVGFEVKNQTKGQATNSLPQRDDCMARSAPLVLEIFYELFHHGSQSGHVTWTTSNKLLLHMAFKQCGFQYELSHLNLHLFYTMCQLNLSVEEIYFSYFENVS